jgi:hypothetical protein
LEEITNNRSDFYTSAALFEALSKRRPFMCEYLLVSLSICV